MADQGRNAVDQLQWREVKLVNLGALLVTRRLAALFGAAVHQLSTFFAQPLPGEALANTVPQLDSRTEKSACRCLTQTSSKRCAAVLTFSKTNWRRPEHPIARLQSAKLAVRLPARRAINAVAYGRCGNAVEGTIKDIVLIDDFHQIKLEQM